MFALISLSFEINLNCVHNLESRLFFSAVGMVRFIYLFEFCKWLPNYFISCTAKSTIYVKWQQDWSYFVQEYLTALFQQLGVEM
jgi:hypothetical protein